MGNLPICLKLRSSCTCSKLIASCQRKRCCVIRIRNIVLHSGVQIVRVTTNGKGILELQLLLSMGVQREKL